MSRYEYGIDFDKIAAIDIHTHVEIDGCGHRSLDDELMAASEKYFKSGEERTPTIDTIADHYRARNMAAVVFTVDAGAATGHAANSVEEIAEGAARHNDVLIPFGSVDPWQGKAAVRRVHRLVDEYGVKGFKFHPSMQGFEPNDRRFYPLYEAITEAGVPALFHTGQTGIGAGLPGGHGIKLRYSDPMLLDDVAADFPDLTVIMAHPAVPWVDAQISIATHKANVFIDLSGWSPKYFPPQLVKAANSMLRGKVLFGSDFPVIQVDRWMTDFANLDIKPEVAPLIFKRNALRVLGIKH
ncbi:MULTISPECIES: 4-hydroxyphenyl-beta-ketoacyl-CoA hydrolase [unclassified Rhodococcus (in: high G+C Gram-positive bacteria)]|uniref:4-hydroxyphenyl-beta-ketoacyl-CoA hydrolase n=1 Tax=unclassified Rhodococcus (in: high G+C Gram-positive bacteria) TaxID=192944 RepID=UPI00163A9CF6|nr:MULTISPECIES: 4-hydroxyphenyl-beta-ketoacyl-CoA hydrolase [unclassified Rhodococcus (in: high G+C Gram-positive bacteria)]MBC2642475.1 4-hydroxyphenyl-beta-ketoacyl-CoA hydrolase [Rhodococcus sp. 3A]MBC2892783.1 4-hydroxyphenyl-beta-ketoacyl-CoA hydrolase [Rhodococcus sp. 4CII]